MDYVSFFEDGERPILWRRLGLAERIGWSLQSLETELLNQGEYLGPGSILK